MNRCPLCNNVCSFGHNAVSCDWCEYRLDGRDAAEIHRHLKMKRGHLADGFTGAKFTRVTQYAYVYCVEQTRGGVHLTANGTRDNMRSLMLGFREAIDAIES